MIGVIKKLFGIESKQGAEDIGDWSYDQLYDCISAQTKDLTDTTLRDQFHANYAWSIPSREAVRTVGKFIDKYSDCVISIGSGRALWEYLLGEFTDKTIITTDDKSWEVDSTFLPVEDLNSVDAVGKHKCNTMLVIWPPYNDSMAYDAITIQSPQFCIYIGEGIDGCTSNDDFHNYLNEKYCLVGTVSIPNWDRLHDKTFIYELRADCSLMSLITLE